VSALRQARRAPPARDLVAVSGADPLNLCGVLTPGPRIPALAGNRLLYRDGVPVAWLVGGQVAFAPEVEPREHAALRDALIRRHAVAPALDFLR
jgi:ATP-dependent Lhr-like helicase